jgi:hypothetical protein
VDIGVCNAGVVAEMVGFQSHFKDLPDHRQPAKVIYPLADVLLLCLLVVCWQVRKRSQRCFVAWVASVTGLPEGVIVIDGKALRRSRSASKDTTSMVSVFAARQRLVLGQAKVADKANEIVAIPKLLAQIARHAGD